MEKSEILKEVKKKIRMYSQLVRKAENILNKTFTLPNENLTQSNAKILVKKYHDVIAEVQKELLNQKTLECNRLHKKMDDYTFGSCGFLDGL